MNAEEQQALAEQVTYFAGELDSEAVTSMMTKYPDILNWWFLVGSTPLGFWVLKGNTEAVKLLLDLGADVNAPDEYGCTPLMTCCDLQYRALARLLLERGADPNVTDDIGNCALLRAIDEHDAAMVALLLANNADPNFRQPIGHCALVYAICNDNYAIAKLLLEHGADPNDEEYILYYIAEMDVDPIKYYDLLSEYNADLLRLSGSETHPVFLAMGKGDVAVVRYFVDKGMDLQVKNQDGESVAEFLETADPGGVGGNVGTRNSCKLEHREPDSIPVDFTKSPSETETEERYALAEQVTYFAGELDSDAVKALIAQYPDILSWGYLWGETPLHYWVVENHMEAVKMLVDLGADVNVVDDYSCPALVTCCQMEYLEMARFLLDRGVDPDSCDEHENALFHALEKHDAEMVELLLKYNANPNVRDFCGVWLLFEAIYQNGYEIARLLLEYGADPNVDDDEGDSLHYLIYSEMEVEPIKYYDLLFEYNADLQRLGESAKHPIFPAVEKGDVDVARYFLKLGMDLQVEGPEGESLESALSRTGMHQKLL